MKTEEACAGLQTVEAKAPVEVVEQVDDVDPDWQPENMKLAKFIHSNVSFKILFVTKSQWCVQMCFL